MVCGWSVTAHVGRDVAMNISMITYDVLMMDDDDSWIGTQLQKYDTKPR